MPTGVYKRTKEHYPPERNKKISLSLLGNTRGFKKGQAARTGMPAWNKGKKGLQHHSEETRKKLSEALKGRKVWNKGKTGYKMPPCSEERKNNISKSHLGKKRPNISGENHYLWKGGIAPINNKIRQSVEYSIWSHSVMCRDNFTDQKTGIRGGKLVAHHILNFSSRPELRFAIDNGVTLSVESHRAFHRKYGIKNNTKEQLLEFLNNPR